MIDANGGAALFFLIAMVGNLTVASANIAVANHGYAAVCLIGALIAGLCFSEVIGA